MSSPGRVIGVVRPRPVAADERHHAEHLELDAGRSLAPGFGQGLVQERADVLVPARPQMGAGLGQQHGRPQPGDRRSRGLAMAAEEAIGGRVDGAGIGRFLPKEQFHQVGGDQQVRIAQGLVRFRQRTLA